MPPLKISIVGAGPAGCMLGRILSLSNIPFQIYEGDESPDYRSQGGSLDLHPGTGLAAMKDAKLWDEFLKHGRFDGDYMLMADKDLRPLMQFGPGNKLNERPEIDRAELRRILAESLPEGSIKWGYRLRRVEEGNVLVFDHTTVTDSDLIIGCEGGWSKVQSYVAPAVKPYYSGVGYHGLRIPDAANTAPDVYKLVNRGSVFAASNGKRIAIQQLGTGALSVGWCSSRPGHWMETCEYDLHNVEQVKEAILKDMEDWSPLLREAIEKVGEGLCDAKNLYMLPVGWRWEHRRGATFIGDAAHLMTPFAGEGVNAAFDDARKLAAAIVRVVQVGGGPDEVDKAVKAAEEDMFERMKVYQRQTDEVTKLWFFSKEDIKDVIPKVMIEHAKAKTPTVLHPLIWGLINLYWFVKKRTLG